MSSLIDATDFEWPVVAGPCGADGPANITPEQWAAVQDAAVRWLWSLSGRQFGTWTVVWRPEWTNPPPRPVGCGLGSYARALTGTGLAADPARAAADPRVTVLPGPVVDVSEVRLAGAVLPSSGYEMQGDRLVRIDGQAWPRSQDTTLVATQAGTWQVTYTRGRPVPAGGQVAAGILACELAAAILGNTCKLPANVTSVVRNGVTINRQLDQLILGFTGLSAVDQWARQVNPKARPSDSAVWSPDLDPNLYPQPFSYGGS
ncbi:hypothetical protein [uncultured Jatrophihabitans sp.]|uniref:hypothetical protein n=1 Tax=uncultured Jatrophihabitans sp. TaxID=1610747 RepID=UPI0035CAB1A3